MISNRYIPLPDEKARIALLKMQVEGEPTKLDVAELKKLASKTERYEEEEKA